jgi:hypothetical protein
MRCHGSCVACGDVVGRVLFQLDNHKLAKSIQAYARRHIEPWVISPEPEKYQLMKMTLKRVEWSVSV